MAFVQFTSQQSQKLQKGGTEVGATQGGCNRGGCNPRWVQLRWVHLRSGATEVGATQKVQLKKVQLNGHLLRQTYISGGVPGKDTKNHTFKFKQAILSRKLINVDRFLFLTIVDK